MRDAFNQEESIICVRGRPRLSYERISPDSDRVVPVRGRDAEGHLFGV